jgi:TIR domain
MRRPPSVFISYSWDSIPHKRWVLQLAERLIRNGVKVWIDQLNLRPGESLTRFMESKIKSSGHVLVICTPAYAKRANKRLGGVGYEQQIISGRIAAGIPRRKFIPIVRAGEIDLGPRCALQHLIADLEGPPFISRTVAHRRVDRRYS